MITIIRDTQHHLYDTALFRNCILYSNFFFAVSCGHMPRGFLILVIIVILEVSITNLRGLTSHLFHSSMVWEQIFSHNCSLLRSLSAFCEHAVAADFFGYCLQRQNKEFIHQNHHSQSFANSTLWHCIFDSQPTELKLFQRSLVLFHHNSETMWSSLGWKVAGAYKAQISHPDYPSQDFSHWHATNTLVSGFACWILFAFNCA